MFLGQGGRSGEQKQHFFGQISGIQICNGGYDGLPLQSVKGGWAEGCVHVGTGLIGSCGV